MVLSGLDYGADKRSRKAIAHLQYPSRMLEAPLLPKGLIQTLNTFESSDQAVRLFGARQKEKGRGSVLHVQGISVEATGMAEGNTIIKSRGLKSGEHFSCTMLFIK